MPVPIVVAAAGKAGGKAALSAGKAGARRSVAAVRANPSESLVVAGVVVAGGIFLANKVIGAIPTDLGDLGDIASAVTPDPLEIWLKRQADDFKFPKDMLLPHEEFQNDINSGIDFGRGFFGGFSVDEFASFDDESIYVPPVLVPTPEPTNPSRDAGEALAEFFKGFI